MFHIGIATQHPPLPNPNEMSDVGISFIEACVTLDPTLRPSAAELLNHLWLAHFNADGVSLLSIPCENVNVSDRLLMTDGR